MAHIDFFCTEKFAPRRRIQYWNDLASQAFTPQVVDAHDQTCFDASLKLMTMQDIALAEVTSDPAVIHHSKSHAASAQSQRFFIEVQLTGRSAVVQDGREARLEPGDFTLCDTSRPYRVAFDSRVSMLVLSLDAARLRRFIGYPEVVTAIRMGGGSGLSGVASELLRRCWHELKSFSTASVESHVSAAMLNVLASAYISVPRACCSVAPVATTRRLSLLTQIEESLTDPDLSPSKVAAKSRMSTRYAHRLFAAEGETIRQYILRRRLEVCCEALANPTQRGRSITSIATDAGFSSLAQFCTVFRERYGVTPGEYRAQRPFERQLRKLA